MKKIVLLIAFSIGLWPVLNAQWVSPGNGRTYTMSDLVSVTNGVVTYDGFYHIHADLTISQNDILKIDNGFTKIFVEDAFLTINGSMICENDNRVSIMGEPAFSMLFDNATGCEVKNMYFSDGKGIKLIESDVHFNDVKFVYFTTEYCHSAIDIYNSNPVIENCYFLLNEGAAIGSPANGQSSPQILNCEFDSNVDGANVPQINLGPGSNDTIRIVGNLVDGTYAHFHTGGISIADLMGTGNTKILLKDNVIKRNRYGYNQQGYHLSSVITGNEFLENFHEDNPMNGGSGISIYGFDGNNNALLRNNVITGNLWGITVINAADVDMGTEDDWGYNQIHDNVNSGTVYDLYNNSTWDIMAVGNDWGTTSEREIEAHIVHQVDIPSLGLVTYIPFIGDDAVEETTEAAFVLAPNPSQGRITVEGTGRLTLINTLGQTLLSKDLDGKETIDLPRGIYLVKLGNATKKVVVE